jgi:hypothetical protein
LCDPLEEILANFRRLLRQIAKIVILTADFVTQAVARVKSRYELRKLNLVGYFHLVSGAFNLGRPWI